MIAEGRGHWDDWDDRGYSRDDWDDRGYHNYGRHHHGRGRDYYDDEWSPRTYTDHGDRAWKWTKDGYRKPSASLKRQRNRMRKRRNRCRHCNEQESALLSDFYDKFDEDEVDFIAGFLND